MIYLVAILIVAGGTLVGWQLGLAVFMAVFEILRWLHLETLLDSRTALRAFRYAHIAAAIVAGLWLLRRWRPLSDQATSNGKIVLIATVAGMGCALLATPVVIFFFKTAQTLAPLLGGVLTALALGATITAMAYSRQASRAAIALRGALATIIATTVIWLGFIFEVEMSGFAARLGPPSTVLIDIRVPQRRPELATIRIALRSEGRDFPGRAQYWLTEGDGGILRASVPLVAGTRDRIVVLTLPEEPERRLRIDLPARPRTTQHFGPWIRFEPAGDPVREARYRIR